MHIASRGDIGRPRNLPTGTVTFMFGDIEGSTTRWETYRDAMAIALRRHDELMHAAVAEAGGHVFKTVGDEFCTVYHSVSDAIAAALAAQRAIAAEDWSTVGGLRVRMAIHTGTTDERNDDYYGPTVNRVARLLSTAHGGQIVLSGVSTALAAGHLPTGVFLRDLGKHRLKDVAEAENISQLVASDLPEIFPPLRAAGTVANNLPQHLPELLGREAQSAEITTLLKQHRLLTLAGMGGVGKTRIALQTAFDNLEEFADGVWFVELAPLNDAALVPSAIAASIGIAESDGRPMLEVLAAYLKTKDTLIVLDNCEHLVAGAANAVAVLLRDCRGVRVLATTREALRVPGERVYRLPTLSVPPAGVELDAESAMGFGAVALFVARAHAHASGFLLTDANAVTVAEICRQLDGIALAIELAVPRLRILSVPQLSEKLRERFRVLTGGNRTSLPRQQTLRALIDWSYDLLSEHERVVLRRVAIFSGGCTLQAVCDVCCDDDIAEWDVIDLLTSLVDKSLVVAENVGLEQRYRMLESTREYALEKLGESRERDVVARRHAAYYLGFAQHAREMWATTPTAEWAPPIVEELDNVRAVLDWSLDCQRDPELGIAMIGALEQFWWDVQPIEGRRWIAKVRSYVDDSEAPQEVAHYWLAAANVALSLHQHRAAVDAAERAVAACGVVGDPLRDAEAKRCLGAALLSLDRLDDGEPLLQEALAFFLGAEARKSAALAMRTLATIPHSRGKLEDATLLYREALALSEKLGDARGTQIVAGNLAEVEFASGNVDAALGHGLDALKIARERLDRVTLATLLINVAAYLLALERLDEARSFAREALTVARDADSDVLIAVSVQHLATVAVRNGDAARGALLLGFGEALLAKEGVSREPGEEREFHKVVAEIEARIDAETVAQSLAEGAKISVERALREAAFV